jgi:hypothetical protein
LADARIDTILCRFQVFVPPEKTRPSQYFAMKRIKEIVLKVEPHVIAGRSRGKPIAWCTAS